MTAAVAGSGGQAPYKTRNSIYRGGLINNAIRDGVGICKWDDGNVYDGEKKGTYLRSTACVCIHRFLRNTMTLTLAHRRQAARLRVVCVRRDGRQLRGPVEERPGELAPRALRYV